MAPSNAVPVPVNTDIKTIHTDLIAIAAGLDEAVGRAKTVDEVNGLLEQLADVNHRVTALGRKLFAQQTAGIHQAATKVMEATEQTKKDVAELDKISDILANVPKFLGLVDKLLAVAGPLL